MAQELVMEIKQKSTEKGVAAQYDKTVPIGVLAENVLFEDGSNLTDNLNVYVFQDKSDQGYSSLIESDSLQTITHTFKGTYFPSFEQLQRFFINKTCILKSYLGSNQFQLFLLDFVNVPYDNGIRFISSPIKSKLSSAQLFHLQVWVTLNIPASSDTIECTYTFEKYTVTHTTPGEMTQNQYNRLFNYIQNGNSYIRDTSQNGKVWCVGTGGSASGVPGWRDIPTVSSDEAGIVPAFPSGSVQYSYGKYVLRSKGWGPSSTSERLAEGQVTQYDDQNTTWVLEPPSGKFFLDYPLILLNYTTATGSCINTMLIRSGWLAGSSNSYTLVNPLTQKYFKIAGGDSSVSEIHVTFKAGSIPSIGDHLYIYGLY